MPTAKKTGGPSNRAARRAGASKDDKAFHKAVKKQRLTPRKKPAARVLSLSAARRDSEKKV